jgi:hypothetical protein
MPARSPASPPNRVAGQPCSRKNGEQWLNPNAYTLRGFQLGSIGTARRGDCEGPDFFQVDLAFYKDLRIMRRLDAQFRIELFNVTDEVNFWGVETVMNPTTVTLDAPLGEATTIVDYQPGANFGRALRVRDPRQIQLGFKLFI